MANIKIRTRNSAVAHLVRPRPDRNRALEIFAADGDSFLAYVSADVLDFIKRQAKLAGDDEAIGLLAGRICHDPRSGPYTLVMAVGEARRGEFQATESSVRLLPVGHSSVRRRLEDAYPDREIVGWYHTHPHYQPRFSDVDMGEQATWNDPNYIGIVYSGINKGEPFGVYRGPRASLLRPVRDEGDEDNRIAATVMNHSPQRQPRDLTPRPGPLVLSQDVLTSKHAAPLRARYHKVELLVLAALALVFVGQSFGLFWLHRRVSVAEGRLQELAAVRSTADQSGEKGSAQSSSTPALTPIAVSPSASQSDDKAATTDGPELRPRAKPLTPTTKERQKSRTRKSAVSRLDTPSKDRDRQSRPENRSVKSKTQRAGVKSVETKPLPKVVAPRPAPLPTPRQ